MQAVQDGGVVLSLTGLAAGAHQVRIGLLERGAGTFTVAPAHIVIDGDAAYGITPAMQVVIP